MIKKLALAVFYLVSIWVAVEFGARAATKNQLKGVEIELAKIQAMLSFNHMQRYAELENDLAKGCNVEALEKVKVSKAQELMLLADFFKQFPDPSLHTYITQREPELAGRLVNYKNPYGASWREPQCGH